MRCQATAQLSATVPPHDTIEVQCELEERHRGLHQADMRIMASRVFSEICWDSTATISWRGQ